MEPAKELHVAAAILIHESKILIARRAPHKTLGGLWEFPGGKIEGEETAEDCLKREILEELSIEIVVGNFFMKNRHQYGTNIIVLHAYLCTAVIFDIRLTDHDEYRWVEKHEMPEYDYAPADIPILYKIIDEL